MKWLVVALGVAGSAVAAVVLIPLAFVIVIAFSLGNAGKTPASASSPLNLGKPVHLGVVNPPSVIVTLDEAVAAAPRSLVSCSVSASLLLAQQDVESDYDPTAASGAGAQGLSQFEPATFAEYAHPVPPGGASPPSPWNPTDSAYAEARMLCSDGVTTNPTAALITYNCGSTSASCQAASSGYASKIISLAEQISALPSKTPTIHA